jgi:hypothetical protein
MFSGTHGWYYVFRYVRLSLQDARTSSNLDADYWIVKKRRYDVPALYDPRGIYSYQVSMATHSH